MVKNNNISFFRSSPEVTMSFMFPFLALFFLSTLFFIILNPLTRDK